MSRGVGWWGHGMLDRLGTWPSVLSGWGVEEGEEEVRCRCNNRRLFQA